MQQQRPPSLRAENPADGARRPGRWRRRGGLALLALALAAPTAALAQRFTAWNPDGSRAGTLVIQTEAGGDTVADYDYKNNGRGPTTQERYRLAADGTPTADRGVIAPGRRADLILVDGEPTVNITDIRRVAGVITQGRWLVPREVHEAIGMKAFVDTTPVLRSSAPR